MIEREQPPMNNQRIPDNSQDWHCGGWEGAERETLRYMASLSFAQKLKWLEDAQQFIADIHGWEVALLPSGSSVLPNWHKKTDEKQEFTTARPPASSPAV